LGKKDLPSGGVVTGDRVGSPMTLPFYYPHL